MKILHTIRNEKGVALMMVMVISAIVLIMMTAMIYMVTVGTKVSGVAKRYTSATEAAEGGVAIVRSIVNYKDNPDALVTAFSGVNLAFGNKPCAKTKIHKGVSDWGACDGSSLIDPNDANTYDYVFDMGDYKVYSKISYTIQGNSAGTGAQGGGWRQMGVVRTGGGGGAYGSHKGSSTGGGGEVVGAHYEYLYNVEIDARSNKNPNERSRLSMLYQY